MASDEANNNLSFTSLLSPGDLASELCCEVTWPHRTAENRESEFEQALTRLAKFSVTSLAIKINGVARFTVIRLAVIVGSMFTQGYFVRKQIKLLGVRMNNRELAITGLAS